VTRLVGGAVLVALGVLAVFRLRVAQPDARLKTTG